MQHHQQLGGGPGCAIAERRDVGRHVLPPSQAAADGGPTFTDDDRRRLYDALEQSIGRDPAAILMAHLPPVGWAELATKGDIVELRGEVAELRGEMRSQLPKLIAANVASMFATAGLVLAAASLA